MAGRVEGKVAILVGGGQTPGETIGNGRATAMLLAREGATVLVVDRYLESAQDTVDMIVREGGTASAIACDITEEAAVQDVTAACVDRFGISWMLSSEDDTSG